MSLRIDQDPSQQGEGAQGVRRQHPGRRAASLETRRAMALISRAHFLEGKSKVEIAEEFGISRFKVARHLKDALDSGMVSITINTDAPLPELGQDLARHLRLQRAQVLEAYGSAEVVRTTIGRAAGTYLNGMLRDGDVLGIGWGRTLDSMTDHLQRLPSVEIVPLAGQFGGGARAAAAKLTQRAVALAGGGPARVIPAPFFMEDARSASAARRHPGVAAVVEGFNRATHCGGSCSHWK